MSKKIVLPIIALLGLGGITFGAINSQYQGCVAEIEETETKPSIAIPKLTTKCYDTNGNELTIERKN